MKHPKTFLFLLLFFTVLYSHAQYNPSKVAKKSIEMYNKALENAQDGKYNAAIKLLEEAIKNDRTYVDAYLSLAGVYGQMKNYTQSISVYEKAFTIDPTYTNEYRLPYAINLAGIGAFDKALETINNLLAQNNLSPNARKAAEYRQKTFQFAVDFEKSAVAKNYEFNPKNLGESVNTAESEYFPSLPIDGGELIFTRRLDNYNEDFFLSEKEADNWTASRRLTGSINTPQNEGAQIISQDGQWLVFTGCNRPDGFGSCDIYISYLTPQGWSEAINLGNQVNTDQWESQPCLSPDKRDLYFVSRRPGGFGGNDIYVSHLQPNGRWSAPENMGAGINTAGEESCPFIHADNQTFYFTSNTWPGYGDDDLFVIRKKEDGTWSEPQNLGYPINTINREGTLFITADGETAYYASDRSDSKGGLDIYSFILRQDIQPAKTLWVKGKVYDVKTGKGLPSAVELINLKTKIVTSKIQTDESGNYLITLPIGNDYAFNVARKGYLFYSDNFSFTGKEPDSTYEKNIPLQAIAVNASVVLKNIFFDFNQYNILPNSETELDKVVQLLKENPTVKIQISGHTDKIGSDEDNLKLSQNRAKAVINYLTSKGIDSKRLSFKGYGATKPVADNETEKGRAQNRRTELMIIGQ